MAPETAIKPRIPLIKDDLQAAFEEQQQSLMNIQPLPEEVIARLRSDVAVIGVVQCVDELLQNAIDAGATCIAVRLDLQFFKMQVIDNGRGMDRNDLRLLGERYATSKCHSLEDFQSTSYYGYRGEAIASICKISQSVTIITKAKSGDETYIKSFYDGTCSINAATVKRPSPGTTVTVCGFLHKLPVRQAMINAVLDVEKVRRCIESMAIIQPGISFSLRDDNSDTWCFRIPKTPSAVSTFAHIFGSSWVSAFKPFRASDGPFTLTGFFALKGHRYKNLQFLYVQRRRIMDSRVQQVINEQYGKVLGSFQKDPGATQETASPEKASQESLPVFILEVNCPREFVDIGLHPSKTVVEFKKHNVLLELTRRSVTDFFSVSPANCKNAGLSSESGTGLESIEGKLAGPALHIDVQNCKHSLYSLPARRPHRPSETCRRSKENEETEFGGMGLAEHGSDKMSTPDVPSRPTDTKYTSLKSFDENDGKQPTRPDRLAVPTLIWPMGVMQEQTKIRLTPALMTDRTPLGRLIDKSGRQDRMAKALADLRKFSCTATHRPVNGYDKNRHPQSPDAASRGTFGSNPGVPVNAKDGTSLLPVTAAVNQHLLLPGGITEPLTPLQSKRIRLQEASCENRIDIHRTTWPPDVSQPFDTIAPTQVFQVSVATEDGKTETATVPPNSGSTSDGQTGGALVQHTGALENHANTPSCHNCQCLTRDSQVIGSIHTPFSDIPQAPSMGTSDKVQLSRMWLAADDPDLSDPLPCSQPKMMQLQRESDKSESSDSLSFVKPCSPLNLPLRMVERDDCTATEASAEQHDSACGPEDLWLLTVDPFSKRNVYVNSLTGHSYFGQPPSPKDVGPFRAIIPGKPLNLDTTDEGLRLATLSLPSRPWRSAPRDDSECSSQEEEQNSDRTIENLLQLWKNPVFKAAPLEVTIPTLTSGMHLNNASQALQMKNQPHTFTKDIFRTLNVIAQVDQKFILCSIGNLQSEDSVMTFSQPKLLVLFDQHAVHERIRLEDLITAAESRVTESGLMELKSSALDQPLCLSLPVNVVRIGLAHKRQLLLKGLDVASGEDATTIKVDRVPCCLNQREASECKMKRPSVIANLVENLICDLVQMLESTGAVGSTMPKVIMDVLKSQACHGAIKFGECLTVEDCRQLMEMLAKCQLPFYCAHGRPSIVPLVDLDALQFTDEEMKPKLWRLLSDSSRCPPSDEITATRITFPDLLQLNSNGKNKME